MSQRCRVCDHRKRDEIDRELVGRPQSVPPFSGEVRIPLTTVYRHYCEHLPATLAKAQGAREAAKADDLLGRLLELVDETRGVLTAAKTEKNHAIVLQVIARAENQIELQARLAGELRDSSMVNLLVVPEWRAIQRTIGGALAPFPDARRAVAAALMQVSGGAREPT